MSQKAAKVYKKNNLSEAIIHAAVALSSALAPKTGTPVIQTKSPAKNIDSRSKCYKQLSGLSSLRESGILTNKEYLLEKSDGCTKAIERKSVSSLISNDVLQCSRDNIIIFL